MRTRSPRASIRSRSPRRPRIGSPPGTDWAAASAHASCRLPRRRRGRTGMYERFFDLILSRVTPERAHAAAFAVLDALGGRPRSRNGLRRLTHLDDELIRVNAFGLNFPSPLGVAAGPATDAEHYEGLGALGYGYVEAGTT